MKPLFYIYTLLTLVCLSSCEDKIDLDIPQAAAKIVIVGDLDNIDAFQEIRISSTVPISNSSGNSGIDDAEVTVTRADNQLVYRFTPSGNGLYTHRTFLPVEGRTYHLKVVVQGQEYTSTSTMPVYVPVDSIGLKKNDFFGEEFISVNFRFQDPLDVENAYKYKMAKFDDPFRFISAYNDKFNDGLSVEHSVFDRDYEIELGDRVSIIRTCIDKNVYHYFSDLQSLNPGSLAPANPRSNISNQALGYFSVGSARLYQVEL